MTFKKIRNTLPTIALVVPELTTAGGVPAVADFLYKSIQSTGRYQPVLVSVPMSSKDASSVRLVSPKSWFSGPKVRTGLWKGRSYQHVGATFVEFEFLRYMPRGCLTNHLNKHDLIQVVAGTPAWAMLTKNTLRPVLLQVATLVRHERESKLSRMNGFESFWANAMTLIVSRLEPVAISHVAKIFVENGIMYKWACKHRGSNFTVFAPPGVDTDIFQPGQYKAGSPILAVGRFADKRKNVEMLFRAYAQLRSSIKNAPPLIIAGKSLPEGKALLLASKLNILDKIIFKKNISVSELAELYRNASMLVLTSNEEGLGIVILEAMASGIPVIATRCGGPEMVVCHGETGYLIDKEDYVACADRMKVLLIEPSLAHAMGEKGRLIVENRFSLQAASKVFIDAYDDILYG